MRSPSRLPLVTLVLIAANLFAAFAIVINPDLIQEFGFRADRPRLVDAFSCLFLHANVFHLLGNMVFLAAVGAAVELATGSLRFASVYFLSGLIGVLLHFAVLRRAPDPVPYIGASGCIAGCAGYYSVRYTRLRVPIAPRTAISVATVTGVWLALQVAGAFIHLGEVGGTAYWAHLGGFATGIFMSLVYRAPDLGHARLGHAVLEEMNDRGPAAVIVAARRHLKDHPGDPKVLKDLARACAQMDDRAGEAEAILEMLGVLPEVEHPAMLGRLVEIGAASRLSSNRRTLLADRMKGEHPAIARSLLRSVLEAGAVDPQRPEAILALAELERDREPAMADALLEELKTTYPLHPCTDLARTRGWLA